MHLSILPHHCLEYYPPGRAPFVSFLVSIALQFPLVCSVFPIPTPWNPPFLWLEHQRPSLRRPPNLRVRKSMKSMRWNWCSLMVWSLQRAEMGGLILMPSHPGVLLTRPTCSLLEIKYSPPGFVCPLFPFLFILLISLKCFKFILIWFQNEHQPYVFDLVYLGTLVETVLKSHRMHAVRYLGLKFGLLLNMGGPCTPSARELAH